MFDIKINTEKTIYASFRREEHARAWAREQSSGDSIVYHVRDRRPPVTREIARYFRGQEVTATTALSTIPKPGKVELVDLNAAPTAAELAEQAARDVVPEMTCYEKGLATGGRFIDSIKAVRERTGCSLGAAKKAADRARGFND